MEEHPPLFPHGESLRNAVRWLASHDVKTLETIEEACQRFNLSPADEEFLIRHFVDTNSLASDAGE